MAISSPGHGDIIARSRRYHRQVTRSWRYGRQVARSRRYGRHIARGLQRVKSIGRDLYPYYTTMPRYRFLDRCVNEEKKCAYNKSKACRSTDSYQGRKSVTRSGLRCQRWDSQQPHAHEYLDAGSHNNCRNPNGMSGPWCITTNRAKPWDLCFNPCLD